MIVFVLNQHGEKLMPCSPRTARKLLEAKKAKIISRQPFAIQLLYGSRGYKQPVSVGVDLGAKHVGVAVTSETRVLAKGEIELRDDVSNLITTRRELRRSRRNRNTRYRRCKFHYHTQRYYSVKKKKWVKSKRAFTSPRPEGWLPPSLRSRIENTFRWIDRFMAWLPNPKLSIEVGKFDAQKMMNPDIQGVEYQEGQTAGYYDVRYFVFARDNYTCQMCHKKKDKILHTHHIVYRSKGGSNRADNLITICTECHTSANHKEGGILWDWMQKHKKVKQYKETAFMNVQRQRVFAQYPDAHITYGSTTTPHRKELGIEKTHANDAIAISGIPTITKQAEEPFLIRQFRKKKRSLHEATARTGRKWKNRTSKRNRKNVKHVGDFYLNDRVIAMGKVGFITGFSGGSMAYVKDAYNEYIGDPERSYKKVNLTELRLLNHNNNWQYIAAIKKEGNGIPPTA